MPTDKYESLAIPIADAELRAVDKEGLKIIGYATKYGNWYPVWDFLERVAHGAFDVILADDETDVVASMNHNADLAFARQSAGTLRLTSNSVGLLYEADVTDEDGKRVHEKIRSGTLKGSSFMFEVAEDKWEFTENETPKRTITRIQKLYELGPVVWPANNETTAKSRAAEILAEARSRHVAALESVKAAEHREEPPVEQKPPEKAPETVSPERKKQIQEEYDAAGRIINRITRTMSPDV